MEEDEEFSDPKYVCSWESLGKNMKLFILFITIFSLLLKTDKEIYV